MKALKERKELFTQKLYEIAGMSPMIELHGSGELMLSGCRCITDYTDEKIIANTLLGTVAICGRDLKMQVYRGDILSIEGKIHMIRLGGEDSDIQSCGRQCQTQL